MGRDGRTGELWYLRSRRFAGSDAHLHRTPLCRSFCEFARATGFRERRTAHAFCQ